jgi:hypothetical protein
MAHLLGLIEHEDFTNKLIELTERVTKLEKGWKKNNSGLEKFG